MSTPVRSALAEAVGDRIAPADLDRIAVEVERLIAEERARCARRCRDRADLWRNTAAARSTISAAVAEARARANEAQYLADLLELGR
jgi:hypothetical protein